MSVTMEVDLSAIPIIPALRDRTLDQLKHLNSNKIIFTDDTNVPRDWRGVAHHCGINLVELAQSTNPIAEVLKLWNNEKLFKGEIRPSIKDLQDILGYIDRWDVYDDTKEMMMKDAEHYIASQQSQPVPVETVKPFQNGCLTIKDVDRIKRGLPLFIYDAFLLFADEDYHYARVMIDKLESDYNMNLVVKDRDLLVGGGFEYKAITQLIAERCASVIVICSPNLLKSDEHMFCLEFSQYISITQRERNKRIIPCVYEPCDLPHELSLLSCLYFQSLLKYGNFWDKIKQSVDIAAMTMSPQSRAILPGIAQGRESSGERCVISEVATEEIQSTTESAIAEQTAILKMSDPTTHFPGNSIEDSSKNKLFANKLSSNLSGPSKNAKAEGKSSFTRFSLDFPRPFKKTESKSADSPCDITKPEKKSLLNVLKKKKLFKRKAVACEA